MSWWRKFLAAAPLVVTLALVGCADQEEEPVEPATPEVDVDVGEEETDVAEPEADLVEPEADVVEPDVEETPEVDTVPEVEADPEAAPEVDVDVQDEE